MVKNNLQLELESQSSKEKIINLIDTNFHQNGYVFPSKLLQNMLTDYVSQRMYNPDSKGDIKARESISGYYHSQGVNIHPENIIVTASSSESYNLIFNNFTEPYDNILLPQPGYPLFEYLGGFSRLECRFYEMPYESSYSIDIDSIISLIDSNTKILVLISPNNPTGQIISKEQLEKLLEICHKHRIFIISDEVFSEFLYESSIKTLPRPSDIDSGVTVFTLNGISKMFASPDLKLSWIAISGKQNKVSRAMNILDISNDVFLNCNSISQFILPKMFEQGKLFQNELLQKISNNRNLFIDKLKQNRHVSFIEPKGGIHCIVKLQNNDIFTDDEDFAIQLLRKTQVYVHPGYFYGIEDKDSIYVIMSFLKNIESLLYGVDRFNEFLSAQ